MCGVCGILGKAEHLVDKSSVVREMMKLLEHRGPDDQGIDNGKLHSLGHQRLSIIDIEHGKQPMLSEDGRYILTFNGEIYNYIELRHSLSQKGVKFRTHSDTEVLLQGLIHEGEEFFQHLNGMFALVFYNTCNNKWIMARDHFGIKPLYYTSLNNQVVFASEIKALLAHPEIKAEVNWRGLQSYFTFQFCLHGHTLFKNINAIEPGCYIKGEGGKILETRRYWDTDYRIDEDHTEEYFIDRLRELIEDSMRMQVRSDVPLGAYLSGGIDSSVVALLASQHLDYNIKTFHGRFTESSRYDESNFAKIVADKCGAELFSVAPTADQFVETLPKLIYAMDEPAAGPGLFPQHYVSKLASEHVKVMLSGLGGDEIFGGYARYQACYLEQALKGAIFETQEEGKHLVTLSSIIPNLPLLKQYVPLMKHFFSDGFFDDMDKRYFRMINRSPEITRLLSNDMQMNFNHEEVFLDFQNQFNHPDTLSYINKMTHFDQKALLPALLQVEDRMSMAVSVESRVPLLDWRITDLVTKMPPQIKFRGGRVKYIFKEAVKNLIPEQIYARKDKMGFPVPLKEWAQKPPVSDFICDTLLGKSCRERGLFNMAALEKLINGANVLDRQLWGVLCLELWHQQFID